MNNKNKGEIGERIAIGELAKFGIDVLIPLTDNLPFDFVIFYNNKMFKCQVKTTSNNTDPLEFDLRTNNWYSKTIKIYNENEVDIFILCDFKEIYIFKFNELKNRKTISLRKILPDNGQIKKINLCKDYIISENRIKKIFT